MRILIAIVLLVGCAPASEPAICDNDGDGLERSGWDAGVECAGDDCDDQDPGVGDGSPEVCNGLDDDCNGRIPAGQWDNNGEPWASEAHAVAGSEGDHDGDGIMDCADRCPYDETNPEDCAGI